MSQKHAIRILIIEDELKVGNALVEGLLNQHYEVALARTGEEGMQRFRAEQFDLVVLDLMLPDKSGLEVLKSIRDCRSKISVLIVTARESIHDRVWGLDSGADDYLVKPFAFPELLARIRALIRRGMPSTDVLHIADLEVDLGGRLVSRAGQKLDLTTREFDLLAYLVRYPEQVVARQALARDLWTDVSHGSLDNIIDVHIARLRRKVDDPFTRKLVHTVRGVGFVISDKKR